MKRSLVALVPAPSADAQSLNHVTLLLNFFDEIHRRGL